MLWVEKKRLAEEALIATRFTTSTGFARADCPFCLTVLGKPDREACLSISLLSGWFRCWRCHTEGRIDGVEVDSDRTQPDVAPHEMEPPEGYLELCEEPAASAISADPAREYLLSRGVSPSTWLEAHIGCVITGRWADRVIIPVLSPAGEWMGWVSRLWSHTASDPYRTAPGMSIGGLLWNHAALFRQTDEPLIVVESCFDGLPYWPDGAACLGKPKSAQVGSLLEAERPIAVALDGDAWEEGEMLALRLQFEGKRAGWLRLPPKEDPNSVDPAWVREETRRCVG